MSTEISALPTTRSCDGCGAELPLALLACPSCGQLVHHVALKKFAAEATQAEQAKDVSAALTAWRAALQHLPPGTRQYDRVTEKVKLLSDQITSPKAALPATPAGARGMHTDWRKWTGGLGALGLLLLKFKWVVLAVLSKGKLLLLGLSQAKTFFSMALTIGAYTMMYGWRFAVGIVFSIYIHEMGHVAWLRRYGIAASAPMFIPGIGAFVRLNQPLATVGEDARVGLAGPAWGTAATVGALALASALDSKVLGAIAHVSAYINLFNLLPVWQLDGGRAFAALTYKQRGIVAAVLWGLGLLVGDVLLFVLAIAATARAVMRGNAPERGDNPVLAAFLVLAAGLTWLMILAKA